MIITEPVDDAVPELGVGKDGGGGGRIDGLGVGFDDDDHNGGLVIELWSFKRKVYLMSMEAGKSRLKKGADGRF